MARVLEWSAFLLGCVICAILFVPWDLIVGYWWGGIVFLAFPAFIWIVSR